MPQRPPIPLREEEIEQLYKDFDHDGDGRISMQELERVLKEVHDEIAPNPQPHNLHHPARNSTLPAGKQSDKANQGARSEGEKSSNHYQDRQRERQHRSQHETDSDLHDFLCRLMPGCGESMSKEEFVEQVRSWNIPSQDQTVSDNDKDDAREHNKKLSYKRRFSAWWSVKGPEVAFLAFIGLLTLGFSLWQGLIYATSGEARAALGGGVVAAKFSAGALYPIFFFLILSMSRWFATICRQSYIVSRFINWDLSQSFHIQMSCLALVFSLTHAIGHLTGTFVYGSSANRQENLQTYLGTRYTRRSYADYVSTRPGWSGIVALSSFIIIALTSIPYIRKRNYEVFQQAHLLMYLMFAMLAMHGTLKLSPMLGYWLIFPVICVLCERSYRLYLTFFNHYEARLEALDDGTVVITAQKADGKKWRARAGQYILLQVPSVSRFQWHPFTISTCIGNRLQIHIKADGNWTNKLHKVAKEAQGGGDNDFRLLKVGIDGPFGAPAQRFYTFDKSIIVGAGIGVTPFSACLTDLEENFKAQGDPWKLTRTRSFGPTRSRTIARSPSISRAGTESDATLADGAPAQVNGGQDTGPTGDSKGIRMCPKPKPGSFGVRRCDFHWSVREKNDLLWFSDLLNRASDLAERTQHLTLNVQAHITAKRKKLSTHVFRYLLDGYRTSEFPYSALTGLRIAANFGRPDFEAILADYYEDMKAQGWHGRVGVFHCGPPVVGEMLADQCAQVTARAAAEGTGMRFMFHNEVFG